MRLHTVRHRAWTYVATERSSLSLADLKRFHEDFGWEAITVTTVHCASFFYILIIEMSVFGASSFTCTFSSRNSVKLLDSSICYP